jgi:hypothetical protein
VYAGDKTDFDVEWKLQALSTMEGALFSLSGTPLPLYGEAMTFRGEGIGGLTDEDSGEPGAIAGGFGKTAFVRIGYHLFREVHILLTEGQPPEHAGVPTLELHIGFLRNLITGCGVPMVEIPPVPDGYSFIGCLTHDVDFGSIRGHRLDPTMFGFLYRATVGSLRNVGRGRIPIRKLVENWVAAVKLPFVFLGLAKDFWLEFDRYLELEGGRPSTFFVIPYARYPGRRAHGMAPRARGCRYDLSEIAPKIRRLKAAGCEIGLHGIDAWLDSSSGRAEVNRVREVAPAADLGVRMHWLYNAEKSASVLEEAGFSYDSTVGYNETVGYRAGTGQVFKPFDASRLLELPLNVMDTAMFYPSHLDLSLMEGWEVVDPILNNAIRHGGVLTINWHDRSIAPERLWGDFYELLLAKMTAAGAWFSTASQAVSWFRARRSVVFDEGEHGPDTFSARVAAPAVEGLPGMRLRLHTGAGYTDSSFSDSIGIQVSNR